MRDLQKQRTLGALRTRIAGIENRPVFAEGAAALRLKPGRGALAAAPGLVHEVYTAETRNAGASLAFAIGQARPLLRPERSAVFFMQLLHEGQEQGLPYGGGLAGFGLDPASLSLVRVKTVPELLWAMEEALGCRAVATVIAEIGGHPKALDFTAGRRLSLRAAASGSSLFMLRYGKEREATAAQLRWRIDPAVSGEIRFDPRSPGDPRWQVTLEKGLVGEWGRTNGNWLVSWKNGFDLDAGSTLDGEPHRTGTALPSAFPAALGDRLLQTA